MGCKKFGNQTSTQILKHLEKLLNPQVLYNLRCDPLNIYFEVRESTVRKKTSPKLDRLKSEGKDLSRGQRRRFNTRKRTRPKIRSVKKGRTVPLKGRVY